MTSLPPRPVHRGAGAAHAAPASARRGLVEQAVGPTGGFVLSLHQQYPSCLVEGVLHSARQLGHLGRADSIFEEVGTL